MNEKFTENPARFDVHLHNGGETASHEAVPTHHVVAETAQPVHKPSFGEYATDPSVLFGIALSGAMAAGIAATVFAQRNKSRPERNGQ